MGLNLPFHDRLQFQSSSSKFLFTISGCGGFVIVVVEITVVWRLWRLINEDNAQFSVADNPAESFEESEKESGSEGGVGAPRKRRRPGLKRVVSCSEEDLENDSNKPVSRKQQETLQETTLPVKKAKGKSGPKAIWSTELLNDLIDIVANNDSYKRKLIFTNMPKASNADVYRNIVKDINSKCQERGKLLHLGIKAVFLADEICWLKNLRASSSTSVVSPMSVKRAKLCQRDSKIRHALGQHMPWYLICVIIDPLPVRAVWLVLPVAEAANHSRANHPTAAICKVPKQKTREEEPAATAAGPSNFVLDEGPADPLRCDLCGLMCKRKGGLSVHMRAKHLEAY
eukprot:gene11138-20022_t